jgi:hypothetical protein
VWLAVGALIAADAAADQIPTSTIVAGVIALASAALAAWLGARGTLRTADTQREVAFDKRVDDALAAGVERLEVMTADRDRYRELYAQMRLDVREAGLDPDKLGKGAAAP